MTERKNNSYLDLLKEAAGTKGDFEDVGQAVDVKGPMTDGILGYRGDGEMQTHKSASQVLERYYFGKSSEDTVVSESDSQEVSESEEVTEDEEVSEGEEVQEQHPDAEPDGLEQMKKEIEKAVTDDKTEVSESEEVSEGSEPSEGEEVQEGDSSEEAVLKKLISEMKDTSEQSEFTGSGTEAAGKPQKDPEQRMTGSKEEYTTEGDDNDDDDEDSDEEDLDVDDEVEDDEKEKKGKKDNGEKKDKEKQEACKKVKEWGTGLEEKENYDDEDDKDEKDSDDEEEYGNKNKKNGKKNANEAGPVGGPLGHNKSSGITRGKYPTDDSEDLEEHIKMFEKKIEEEDEDTTDIDSDKTRV